MSHKKPDSIKIMAGTYRADRANPNAPKPESGVPAMPKHLSTKARAAWRMFSRQLDGVLSLADGAALEALSEAYADLQTARESLAAHGGGTTYECSTKAGGTMYRAYPEVAQIADADRRLCAWLARFGLTPADRGRVSTSGKPEQPDDPWRDIRKATPVPNRWDGKVS